MKNNKSNTYNVTLYNDRLANKQTVLFSNADSSSYKITYDWISSCDTNGLFKDLVDNYTTTTGYTCTTFYCDESLPILTVDHIDKTKLVSKAEEKIEDYIQDNCDRYVIKEYGSYIYEKIQEKAYNITCQVIEDAKEDYDIPDEDVVIEAIMELIDFDSLYELVDDILHAPVTMEEKLADVGMSMKDFL